MRGGNPNGQQEEQEEGTAAGACQQRCRQLQGCAKKAVAKKSEKAAKSKKNEKPGFFARTKKYFASVKSEMKRVTWPDKKELVNYSVVVCASLVVVGVVIALLDAGFGEALALFSGLRG